MSARHAWRLLWASLLLVAPTRLAHSQTIGSVALIAGSSTDARGVLSNAVTLAPTALVGLGAGSAARVGVTGTWFDNNAWAAGTSAALALQSPLGSGFALTTNADGALTVTSYNATFVTASAVPALDYAWRAVSVFAGGRAAVGTTAVPDAQQLFGVPWVSTLQSVTRTSVAPAYGAAWRVFGDRPQRALTVWAHEDPMRVDGVAIANHTGGATLALGAVTIAGAAGRRSAPDEHMDYASAAASLALNPVVSFSVAAGAYPSDRLTGASRGRYMSAGFSARVGGVNERPLPVPSGVRGPAAGETRLSIRANGASHVELLGDWNDWQPVAAQRAGNGVWYVDLRLAPGDYRYAFRIDGNEWRVPAGTAAVDDGFGGKSAYLTVRDPAAR